jgi:hypothetical protein
MTDSAGPPAGMSLEANSQHVYQDLSQSRGSNWALEGNKGLSAVPVRRSIRVVVRGDRFAILPEQAAAEETLEGGREIPLPGPTSKHIDDIVAAVQQHVRDWGVAGRGLYWRPVLVVHVGPDGAARADELTRLLRNSGIELRASSVAAQRERNTLPRQ